MIDETSDQDGRTHCSKSKEAIHDLCAWVVSLRGSLNLYRTWFSSHHHERAILPAKRQVSISDSSSTQRAGRERRGLLVTDDRRDSRVIHSSSEAEGGEGADEDGERRSQRQDE